MTEESMLEPSSQDGQSAVPAPSSPNVENRGEQQNVGSLDKIRDILFGSQAKEIDRRFARLEERLAKDSADLRDEVRQRLDSLEAYIKGEMASLGDRLRAERDERDGSDQQLSRELGELTRNFEKRTAQIDDQINQSHRELRDQILDQSKTLSDDLRRKHDEIRASLDREATELRSDKTDRSALAAMFNELAMRLNNEFTIPGSEELGNG